MESILIFIIILKAGENQSYHSHHTFFPCGETLLSRGQVSALPLNVAATHVLSQDLVQGLPWGGEVARHHLDLLSVLRALPI